MSRNYVIFSVISGNIFWGLNIFFLPNIDVVNIFTLYVSLIAEIYLGQ